MKKFFTTLLLCCSSLLLTFGQGINTLSVGRDQVLAITTSAELYAWGNNSLNSTTGVLGTASNSPYITTPQKVLVPEGITIKEVSVSATSHFLALDCNNNVWSWGNNSKGQLGDGTQSAKFSPQRVLAGVLENTTYDDGNGYLTNVKSVYTGETNSFALLMDGRVVSWGANSKGTSFLEEDNANGQLGNGDTLDKNRPVFVLDGSTNLPLKNVATLAAKGTVTYALIDNNNDGLGTIYSWGNGQNGALGRNRTGTGNYASDSTISSSKAYPVKLTNGNSLNNIVAISASAVIGMALDVDGYIWTWGNGRWLNATGSSTNFFTSSEPKKVLAGSTNREDNDGIYLIAKKISGGLNLGLAVTKTNRAVAWGGTGECSNGLGGFIGNGTIDKGLLATYVKNKSTNQVDTTVINIEAGWTTAIYQTSDNKFMTWGCNDLGQLGNNSRLSELSAIPLAPPAGKAFLDPIPTINNSTSKITTCKENTITTSLKTNFLISSRLESSYNVRWFKNESLVKEGIANQENNYLIPTDSGTYRVEISYIGNNNGCQTYTPASQKSQVSFYKQEFTIDLAKYCANDATVKTSSSDPLRKPVYYWYATETSEASLGTSISKDTITLDITSTGNQKTVYVSETAYNSGIVFPKEASCDTSFSRYINLSKGENTPMNLMLIQVNETITLTELMISGEVSIFIPGSTFSGSINFKVYGAKKSNNGYDIPDYSKTHGVFSENFEFNYSNSSNRTPFELIIKPNIQLKKGVYFISTASQELTNVLGSGTISLGTANCTHSVPYWNDIADKEIIGVIGFSTRDNPTNNQSSYFYNIKFKTGQHFCSRIPVTLKPATEITQQPLSQSTYQGSSISLSAKTNGILQSQEWLFNNKPFKSINGATPLSLSGNKNEMGEYFVVLTDNCGDHTSKKATITVQDTIKITTQPKTTTLCENSKLSLSVAATGNNPNYTWKWSKNNATLAQTPTFTINKIAKTNAGNYWVEVSDNCGTSKSNLAKVTVDSPTIAATFEQSGGELIGPDNADNYLWLYNGNPAFGENDKSIYSIQNGGDYSLKITEGTCVSTSASQTVIITGFENGFENGFKLYPNPVQNDFTINSEVLITLVTIHNQLGTIIDSYQIKSKKAIINTSNIKNGVYLVKIQTNNTISTTTITVNH